MLLHQYIQLCKVRLVAMVLASTAAGYVLASARPVNWAGLWWTVLGTGLAAAGAATLNQVVEVARDAKMLRTRDRPLPAGRISRGHAMVFGILMTLAGLEVLDRFVNPLTAALGLANFLVYLGIYTPLKTRTSLNTLVGAVCGALPPVMGWTGAANHVSPGAVLLGAILLIWQIPHFLALVWLYRSDYVNAGYRMLPVIDSTGRLTCLAMTVYCLALLPLGLAVTVSGMAGYLFGAASLVLGFGWFVLVLKLQATRSRQAARQVFLASIAYLPLLLLAMLADARTVPTAEALAQGGLNAPQTAKETTARSAP